MTIGARIKELRLRRGLTQDQIAEKLNMNRANFSHYERDTAVPPSEMLGKIADILNTSADYLLGRTVEGINGVEEEPEFVVIKRATQRMTSHDKDRMMSMLRIAFEEAFKEDE